MFRKVAGSFVLVILTSTSTAMAADQIAAGVAIAADRTTEATDGVRALQFMAPKATTRGSILPALYVGLAGLNAYDAYTTLKGVSHGATESNGVIGGAAGSSPAMWAIKGGVTAGSILASERLWRSGRRAQAIGMMVATNAVMAVVGAHNNSVLRNQR